MTIGVIVTSRIFFNTALAVEARAEISAKLLELGHDCVMVSEQDTSFGAIESFDDALKCAKLFADNKEKIKGIIVILPNFGDESATAESIKRSGLDVPVLLQAYNDYPDKMAYETRRDSFCGKLSVANNFYQYGIPFTNTSFHTCDVNSAVFTADLERFALICKVVDRTRGLRVGLIGVRSNTFQTVRYSERILQRNGITVYPIDVADLYLMFRDIRNDARDVQDFAQKLRNYGSYLVSGVDEKIMIMARFGVAVKRWLDDNHIDTYALQCWSHIQRLFGVGACAAMSLLNELGMPGACEADIGSAIAMYMMTAASDKPSAVFDWNNNYGNDLNKCVLQHCSNIPKSMCGPEFAIGVQPVLSQTLGEDNCLGSCRGVMAVGEGMYMKVSTDDFSGKIKMYMGNATVTDDPMPIPGGIGVIEINNMQKLLEYICYNGFEHHVAVNMSKNADVFKEACEKYLGWNVYLHE